MPDPFDLLGRWYDRLFGVPEAGALARLLGVEPGQRVLDLGGGTGRVAQFLAEMQVVVCDLSAGMAREARRKGLLTCRGRAEALPFGDAAFDAVLVVDAFHHFAGQQEAAREMLRVLRPAGRLVLEEPDVRRPAIRLVGLGERLLGMESHMLRLEELQDLFQAAGGAAVDRGTAGAAIRLVIVSH